MIFRVRHLTTYNYVEPVLVAHHQAHLAPRSFQYQTCRRTLLRVTPEPASLVMDGVDYFGNNIAFFTLQDPHKTLTVESVSRVEVRPRDLPAPGETPDWESVVGMLRRGAGPIVLEAAEYTFESPFVPCGNPKVVEYAKKSFPPEQPILAGLLDLLHRIYKDFTYDPAATTLATPIARVLAEKRGVCQDFAHLAIACARSLGLPARYVSGYLRTHVAPGRTRLVGADASHAWFAIFCPGIGWVDFDPTNNVQPSVEHITVAYGRDFGDVSPVAGILTGGGSHIVKVSVDVNPLGEDPVYNRPSLPSGPSPNQSQSQSQG